VGDERLDRIDQLYLEFGRVIFRRSLKLLQNEELARDATHDVFLRFVREYDRFDDEKEMLRWIYRVTTHYCLDDLRRRKRHQARNEEQAAWTVASSPDDPFPDQQLARHVLAQFDETTQAVALGVLVDGMRQEELALALGLSTRTVARRLKQFLEEAKQIIVRSAS
jgi:RNA polymerase sigma-70 factor (ECF subfamily)